MSASGSAETTVNLYTYGSGSIDPRSRAPKLCVLFCRRAPRPSTAPPGYLPGCFSRGCRGYLLGCRRAPSRAGAAPETDRLGHRRAPRRIARRGQWIIQRQSPTGAVISDLKVVGDPQMAAEHLRAIPALEANDVIMLDRASNWNRRLRRFLPRCGTPETGKDPMHLDDQSCKLIGCDLVMSHIAADDLRDLIGINLWWRVFFCQCARP